MVLQCLSVLYWQPLETVSALIGPTATTHGDLINAKYDMYKLHVLKCMCVSMKCSLSQSPPHDVAAKSDTAETAQLSDSDCFSLRCNLLQLEIESATYVTSYFPRLFFHICSTIPNASRWGRLGLLLVCWGGPSPCWNNALTA